MECASLYYRKRERPTKLSQWEEREGNEAPRQGPGRTQGRLLELQIQEGQEKHKRARVSLQI
jgi:hypothetical protein